MNREIKFRAWLPNEETMLYSDNQLESDALMEVWHIAESISLEIQETYWSCPGGNDPTECIRYVIPTQEIMQYTGLKDKNGKDIYEGDVLLTEKGVASVIWSDAAFALKSPGSDAVDWEHSSVYEKSIVIGNIYENPPEILKGGK